MVASGLKPIRKEVGIPHSQNNHRDDHRDDHSHEETDEEKQEDVPKSPR